MSETSAPYFVFQDEVRGWRNRPVQAVLHNHGIYVGRGKARRFIEVPETAPHWWDATPLTKPPPPLEFAIHPGAPHLDNYLTGTEFDLYSTRLITILREAGIKFETFPATMVHYKTGEVLPLSYEVFHLLESRPCMDLERSVIGRFGVERLVLTEECVAADDPFFRIKEMPYLVLIHEDLKAVLDGAGITGCIYTRIDEYSHTSLLGEAYGRPYG